MTPLDTKKGLVIFLPQVRNYSGVDGRLSDGSTWQESQLQVGFLGKEAQKVLLPCRPKADCIILGCNTCIKYLFFPRKYADEMSFQSDLINDRKWLTASLLLFQMEKRGERNCLLYLVKIHMQPCITDPLLWLVSKISRLAATFLLSLVKLQPLNIFYLLSLVNSKERKGAV